MRHIDLGKYGVLLFFLVSGYVIPMSLERHGSLRRFWLGRICRIYPAYLVAIGLFAALAAAGLLSWPASVRAETATGILAHATMLTDPLGQRGAVRVFWTLSYEMIFYLIVSGLYAWNLHRHSARWAVALALTGLLAGPALPDGLFGGDASARRATAAILLVIVVLSAAAYISGRFVPLAGAAGIALVLLPALDAHPTRYSTVIASWQGLLLLAVMFAGTVVFRARHGQIGRRTAALTLAVVGFSVVGAHGLHLGGAALRVWLGTAGAVTVTFAIAYAVRERPVPAALAGLGRISYSLYLLHVIVLFLLPHIIPDLGTRPAAVRAVAALGYLAGVIGLAWLSYRIVEKPAAALPANTLRAAPGTVQGENTPRSV
jgi:peptidoglycan/LPS O-acetylase OafA/YrhL